MNDIKSVAFVWNGTKQRKKKWTIYSYLREYDFIYAQKYVIKWQQTATK